VFDGGFCSFDFSFCVDEEGIPPFFLLSPLT